MAYVQFTKSQIFKNPGLNLACNKIYTALQEFGKEQEFELALTGTVAKIIQGAPLEPVTVIPFVTNKIDVFNFLKNGLSQILKTQNIIIYKEAIHFEVQDAFFEIHFDSTLRRTNDSGNVTSQDANEIPPKHN